MIDVVCVKIGNKYDDNYVLSLYKGIKTHSTFDFKFHVITDNPGNLAKQTPCNIITPQNIGVDPNNPKQAWWYKMYMFAPQCSFQGKYVLYFDLDVIIMNSIDKFVDYAPKNFCICQDFNRQFISTYHVSNSSIMKFRPPKAYNIWSEWHERKDDYMKTNRGDQDYLTSWLAKQGDYKKWWPREWAMSWKWEIQHGGKKNNGSDRSSYYEPDKEFVIPPECSVIVCHGDPKPNEIEVKKIKKYWQL